MGGTGDHVWMRLTNIGLAIGAVGLTTSTIAAWAYFGSLGAVLRAMVIVAQQGG